MRNPKLAHILVLVMLPCNMYVCQYLVFHNSLSLKIQFQLYFVQFSCAVFLCMIPDRQRIWCSDNGDIDTTNSIYYTHFQSQTHTPHTSTAILLVCAILLVPRTEKFIQVNLLVYSWSKIAGKIAVQELGVEKFPNYHNPLLHLNF